jgi:hypothetical protein
MRHAIVKRWFELEATTTAATTDAIWFAENSIATIAKNFLRR